MYGLTPDAFAALPIETRVRLAASDCLGWAYPGAAGNFFPAARPGIPSSLVRPEGVNLGIDCSSFGAYVLITATPKGKWDKSRYNELQIMDAKKPWSPIDAVVNAGVGRAVDAPVPGGVHVTQAWVDARLDDGDSVSGGHFRISIADKTDPDKILVLESSSRTHPLTGGKMGPTWTWTRISDLRKRYPAGVRMAVVTL